MIRAIAITALSILGVAIAAAGLTALFYRRSDLTIALFLAAGWFALVAHLLDKPVTRKDNPDV